MTYVDKFVDLALGSGLAGNGTEGNPWTLDTATGGTASPLDFVWVKAQVPYVGSSALPVSVGGNVGNNTKIIFKCYNTNHGTAASGNFLSDMDPGGDHHQSAIHAARNGVTAGNSGNVNGNGGSFDLVEIANDRANLEFHNFYFNDIALGGGHKLICLTGVVAGLVCKNCKFDNAEFVMHDELVEDLHIIDCFAGSGMINADNIFGALGRGISYINNVLKITNVATSGLKIGPDSSGRAIGNLVVGGKQAVQCNGHALIHNNTFYNQVDRCILMNRVDGSMIPYNNILVSADKDNDFNIFIGAQGGTISENNHNCLWSVNGVPVTPFGTNKSGGELAIIGSDSTIIDPGFADVGNYDFTPTNLAVLRGGKPDIYGNPTPMGAVFEIANDAVADKNWKSCPGHKFG